MSVPALPFWFDTTTDTAGTAFTAHTPLYGGGYTVNASQTNGATINSDNTIYNTSGGSSSYILNGATPLTPDVTCTMKFTGTGGFGLFEMYASSGSLGSFIGYDGGNGGGSGAGWKINIASGYQVVVPYTPTVGDVHTFRYNIVPVDSSHYTVNMWIDGVIHSYTVSGAMPSTGTVGLYLFNNGIEISNIIGFDSTAITIGNLIAVAGPSSITLSLTAGIGSGTGTGKSYNIYRGTTSGFTANPGSLLATVTNLGTTPYIDTTAAPGTMYFYKVTGTDSSTNVVYATPFGMTNLTFSQGSWVQLAAPAQLQQSTVINIVAAGDSRERSANGGSNPQTWAPPAQCAIALSTAGRTVTSYNLAVDGSSSNDWQVGSGNMTAFIAQCDAVVAADPMALLLMTFDLGPNDAAQSGKSGSPISQATYQSNMQAISTYLTARYPNGKLFFHYPAWFSPNAATSYIYGQAGLDLMRSYYPAIDAVIAAGPAGQVYSGDKTGAYTFTKNYPIWQLAAAGPLGTYYLHYTPAGGVARGQAEATAIGAALGLAIGSPFRTFVGG